MFVSQFCFLLFLCLCFITGTQARHLITKLEEPSYDETKLIEKLLSLNNTNAGETMQYVQKPTYFDPELIKKLLSLRNNTVQYEGDQDVPNMIRKRGYTCEEHTVTTEDGYILTLHRIPRRRFSQSTARKTPIFLQHGLLSSSATWVLNTPTRAAAYLLADLGYDVWMGNARGNTYSRKHISLTPDEKAFWQFSYDQMAFYDIPAEIDYVLEKTGYSQLYYMGHSMGTTMFFAGMSRRPEYNSKIREMFALAPVGTVSHIETYLRVFAYGNGIFQDTFQLMGMYEFMGHNSLTMEAMEIICDHFSISEFLCSNVMFLFTGFDNKEFNKAWFPSVMKELMSGTSIYTVLHYAQEYSEGRFQMFDHGYLSNYLYYYGQFTPPLYDVSTVTTPVTLFYSDNDYLADPEDVQYLVKHLPNVKRNWVVKDPDFNHLDFIWADNSYDKVYKPILDVLEHF